MQELASTLEHNIALLNHNQEYLIAPSISIPTLNSTTVYSRWYLLNFVAYLSHHDPVLGQHTRKEKARLNWRDQKLVTSQPS